MTEGIITRVLLGKIVLACLLLAGCSSPDGNHATGTALRVMTYNILVDADNPDYDPWSVRVEGITDTIRRHDPDLVGLQEPFQSQVEELLQGLPEYTAAYHPGGYTDATILYRTERFDQRRITIYWLSPTPDQEYSLGFGNILPRMVIRANLTDLATGREFYFINTHFDNTAPFQENAAPLFLERTQPWAERKPVVITGDFNSHLNHPAYHTLVEGAGSSSFKLANTFDLAPEWSLQTNQDPAPEYDIAKRIDHIFVAGGEFTCARWVVDITTYPPEDRYPSDHFAMIADIGPP